MKTGGIKKIQSELLFYTLSLLLFGVHVLCCQILRWMQNKGGRLNFILQHQKDSLNTGSEQFLIQKESNPLKDLDVTSAH